MNVFVDIDVDEVIDDAVDAIVVVALGLDFDVDGAKHVFDVTLFLFVIVVSF